MVENLRIIRDPNKVAVLVESSRWEIWNILKNDGPLTAESVSEMVNKNVSTVYRHLKKLIEAGFVKEQDVLKKDDQKYVVKEYSAELAETFFLLSEESEKLIASEKETSLLEETIPQVMNIFDDLGLSPIIEERKRALDLMNSLTIKLGSFLGELMGDRDVLAQQEYDHQFEVMRRFLAIFLAQLDEEYNSQAEELRKILLNGK